MRITYKLLEEKCKTVSDALNVPLVIDKPMSGMYSIQLKTYGSCVTTRWSGNASECWAYLNALDDYERLMETAKQYKEVK
jgi:hypothetical protein